MSGDKPPLLLPVVHDELLRAAREHIEHGRRRTLRLRAAGAAVILAVLLLPPSSAALNASPAMIVPSPAHVA
jgi:hypothetical protein